MEKLTLDLELEKLIDNTIKKSVESELEKKKVKDYISKCIKDKVGNIIDNSTKDIFIPFEINGVKIEKQLHSQTLDILKVVSTKIPLFLYGEAGSGKTSIAIDIAKILKLNFYSISVNEQSSKTDFLGYKDAKSNLIRTSFREAYEHGGVYIIDEIDAGNPNVLTVLNSALSNGVMTFPDGRVEQHKDFYCICTANTIGDEGAGLKYIGRNILDAATLDRFVRIKVEYCLALERKILSNPVYELGQTIREFYRNNNKNSFISTRSLIQIDKLLKVGISGSEALEMAIIPTDNLKTAIKAKLQALDKPVKEETTPPGQKKKKLVGSDEIITDLSKLGHGKVVTFSMINNYGVKEEFYGRINIVSEGHTIKVEHCITATVRLEPYLSTHTEFLNYKKYFPTEQFLSLPLTTNNIKELEIKSAELTEVDE